MVLFTFIFVKWTRQVIGALKEHMVEAGDQGDAESTKSNIYTLMIPKRRQRNILNQDNEEEAQILAIVLNITDILRTE
jgi:hypothetical protein